MGSMRPVGFPEISTVNYISEQSLGKGVKATQTRPIAVDSKKVGIWI